MVVRLIINQTKIHSKCYVEVFESLLINICCCFDVDGGGEAFDWVILRNYGWVRANIENNKKFCGVIEIINIQLSWSICENNIEIESGQF